MMQQQKLEVTASMACMTCEEKSLCLFISDHFHGVIGACTDDPAKVSKEVRHLFEEKGIALTPEKEAEIEDFARKQASLSNWWVHDQPFFFHFEGQQYSFRCMEQLMMARKVTEFFAFSGLAAREWLLRIENAENEWLALQAEWAREQEAARREGRATDKSKAMPRFSDRCWPGLVKHFGRSIKCAMDDASDGKAMTEKCASAFTEANKAFLQEELQRAKLATGEESFCFLLRAIAKWNLRNPSNRIHICESTSDDVNYSINADFFGQLLPTMNLLTEEGTAARGRELLGMALASLQNNFNETEYKKNKKALAAGIPTPGQDILGSALRRLSDAYIEQAVSEGRHHGHQGGTCDEPGSQ